jgi:hypothetical protein
MQATESTLYSILVESLVDTGRGAFVTQIEAADAFSAARAAERLGYRVVAVRLAVA